MCVCVTSDDRRRRELQLALLQGGSTLPARREM